MQYFTTFLSKRNVPLILRHLPAENEPLLTIENWESWESNGIYAVYNDGLVDSILDDRYLNQGYFKIVDIFQKSHTPTFDNEVWNPDFAIDLADDLGIEWDKTSFDLLYGRWQKKLIGKYV